MILELTGGSLLRRGRLWFTKEPPAAVYFMQGSNAVLEWDYFAANKTTDLKHIVWSVYNHTDNRFYGLAAEFPNGNIQLNPNMPPEYAQRIYKTGRATLVIKNITFYDSTLFRCWLVGKLWVPDSWSTVHVIVTGSAPVLLNPL